MAVTVGKGFAVPEVKTPILSSLGLIKTDNALGFYKVFKPIAGKSLVAELEASGKVDYTPYERYGMWVDNSKQRNKFQVTANVAITASAAVTVTLATASHTGASNELSPVAVGLFFYENSSGLEFEVTAVSKTTNGAHTATIKPTKSGVTQTIPFADAEFISIGRPTVQESSFQQDGEYSGWGKRFNEISIIRTNKQYSDLTSMVKMEVNGRTYRSIDMDKMTQQHIDAKEIQIVEGDVRNSVTSTGNRATNSQGILSLVKQYGTSLNGGGTGAVLNNQFFRDLSRSIDGNGFSSSYKVLADSEAIYQVQDFAKTNNLANVQVNIVNGNEAEIKAIFDYSTDFRYDGIDFEFKKYDYWNVAKLAGADVSKSQKSNQMLFIPQGQLLNGDNDWQDYLRLKVLLNPDMGTDPEVFNHFDVDGALYGHGTTRNAVVSLTSYMGVDVLGIEQFIYTKLASA